MKAPLTPAQLGTLYKLGLWGVTATGSGTPLGRRPLLRAITHADFYGEDSGISTLGKDQMDVLENAVCHEVIDQGPEVERDFRGLHVVHMASSADSVEPDGSGEFCLVDERDIAMAWDPHEALERVASIIEQMKAAEESRRLRAELSGGASEGIIIPGRG